MASVDYRGLAPQILERVGGEANIATMAHCATRLRLKLKDEGKADKAAIEKLPGVITVMQAGGQYQIVIGNNVPQVYEGLAAITKLGEGSDAAADGPKGSEALIAAPGTEVALASPVTGTVVPLAQVADKVFASAAMGSGLGIIPTDGHVYAPASGTVVAAMKTGHAFGIKTPEGVEVLVHIGLDTVHMQGEGFTTHVTRGAEVAKGDLLAVVDLDAVKKAGFDPTTVMVVTNTAKFTEVAPASAGVVSHGDETVLVTL